MLHEKSQTQRVTYYKILFTWHSCKAIGTEQNKTKNNRLVATAVMREELTTKGQGNEKILYFDHGGGYMTVYIFQYS